MDIQVSSNFERLLFELLDRDPAATAATMQRFRATGAMAVPDAAWHRARTLFHGFRLDDDGTTGRDPPPATPRATSPTPTPPSASPPPARCPARHVPIDRRRHRPPRQVPRRHAARHRPRPPLPPHLADLYEREERFTRAPNDLDAVKAQVRAFSHRNAA